MRQRTCNKYNCTGIMRPTRKLHPINSEHRIFVCPICGNETPWLDKPKLNGAFGELHINKDGLASGLSMMSDPNMCPPKAPRLERRRR